MPRALRRDNYTTDAAYGAAQDSNPRGPFLMSRQAVTTADKFGPAMSKLTVQEQMFVCCFFENPSSMTKAAAAAGYESKSYEGLRQMASRLMDKPQIAEAVKEESKRRNVFLLPKAHAALDRMLDNPQATGHFNAIKLVRDDAGVTRAVERILNLNVTVSHEDKMRELKEFAAAHGGTVLGVPIEDLTTEAEYEQIEAPTEKPITLEDLI